jgi:Rhomboid family
MVPSPLRSRAARSTEGSAAVDRDSSASPRWGRIRVPVATVALWIITALVTTPQILLPAVGELLRRDPIAVSTGQWWRLLTPLLVHPEGWLQVAFDFSSLLIVGAIAERLWGSSRLWLVYLVSGFSGEVAGYAWAPRERRVFRRDRGASRRSVDVDDSAALTPATSHRRHHWPRGSSRADSSPRPPWSATGSSVLGWPPSFWVLNLRQMSTRRMCRHLDNTMKALGAL